MFRSSVHASTWPIALLLLAIVLSRPVGAQEVVPEAVLRQIAAAQAEKAARTPAQRKIASALLFATRQRQDRLTADEARQQPPVLDVDAADRVLVDIVSNSTAASRGAVTASGGAVVDELPQARFLRVRLPFATLELIAARPEVERIRVPLTPIINKINTSQGDTAHRAVQARGLGVTGAGVGIGVLSNGVNTLVLRQSTGDVSAVTVLPGQAGSGDEGTAMLEIVYDLAPGASLFFATGSSGPSAMAANIVALCNAGARVIVDDVSHPGEPVFEDGVVAQAVNTVTASGCHYFSAAGNSGNLNDGTSGVWEGDFVDGGVFVGSARFHSFGGGQVSNLIVEDPSDSPYFTLQWSDKWGASANDYDLYLYTNDGTFFAGSTDDQSGFGYPFEVIDSDGSNHTGFRLVIVKYNGLGRYLHLNTHRSRLALRTAGQIWGHAAASQAYAVAAVNVATASGGPFLGGGFNPVEDYSSDGPRRIFYAANGTPITPGNFSSTGGTVRQKPDITAADKVATSTPGFFTFAGTSAAAPHAAAIAALTLQAAGGPNSLSVTALRNVLLGATVDIEAPGVDRDSGNGIMDAFRAVVTVQPFEDNPLVPGVHSSRTVHISQLRQKIDAARNRYKLNTFLWTEPTLVPGASIVSSTHVLEMRTALSQAYVASGRAAPSFTDANLFGTIIRATHISELRAAVNALP